jgi:hypothetical protein
MKAPLCREAPAPAAARRTAAPCRRRCSQRRLDGPLLAGQKRSQGAAGSSRGSGRRRAWASDPVSQVCARACRRTRLADATWSPRALRDAPVWPAAMWLLIGASTIATMRSNLGGNTRDEQDVGKRGHPRRDAVQLARRLDGRTHAEPSVRGLHHGWYVGGGAAVVLVRGAATGHSAARCAPVPRARGARSSVRNSVLWVHRCQHSLRGSHDHQSNARSEARGS